MKNRLEDEYRQLMQNETPDLWSRIEAGIDAKIAAGNVTNSEVNEEMAEESITKSEEKGKNVVNLWKKYSLPLVACIAAILCVPLLLTGFIRMASGGSKAETTEMAADTAAAEETTFATTDYAETEAAAEETYDEEVFLEETTEESLAEEMDESKTMAEDKLAQTESAPAEEPESMLDGAVTEGADEDNKQYSEESAESVQVLTVTQISQGTEDYGENREKGEVYYLTTEEVGECTMFVPTDLEFVIDLNQQLKIEVEQGNDDYDYVFVKMAE